MTSKEKSKILAKIYYDPKSEGSFGGQERLYRAARALGHNSVRRPDINSFLNSQAPYTLHRPARRHYPTQKTIVAGIDDQWQADLVDMGGYARDNEGYRYILTIIDCFSRFAWALPVKRKDGDSIAETFVKLFTLQDRIPSKLQTDKGREFFNASVKKVLNQHGIRHFATHSEKKAALVERFNRTLKQRMWTYFTTNRTHKYLSVLTNLINSYNKSLHRSTGFAPVNINKSNEAQVWHKLYGNYVANNGSPKRRVKDLSALDTQVRVSAAKSTFEKGYLPNWSRETFRITDSRARPGQHIYKLKDDTGEAIQGIFYSQEIQPIQPRANEDFFDIEKILRKRKSEKTGKPEYFVKWLGWPTKFNSWISEHDLK